MQGQRRPSRSPDASGDLARSRTITVIAGILLALLAVKTAAIGFSSSELPVIVAGCLLAVALVLVGGRIRKAEAATRGAVRAVAHGRHAEGRHPVHEIIGFSAPVAPEVFLARIRETLAAPEQAPGLIGALHLADATRTRLTYAIGSQVASAMTYLIRAQDGARGCLGMATCLTWSESDGLVNGADDIARLAQHVRAATEHFGGACHTVEELQYR